MYKKVKVVMLATQDTTAPIGIDDNSGKLFKFEPNEALWGYQHLYLLSDDKIEENDWFLDDDINHISDNNGKPRWVLRKCHHVRNGWIFYDKEESEGCNPDWSRKIIATTNRSLFKWLPYGEQKYLPNMPNDFIEKYVNTYNANQPIESVDVEYDVKTVQVYPRSGRDAGGFEEYETQEVLKTDKNNRVIIETEKETWTRQEVLSILNDLSIDANIDSVSLDWWIKENL